MPRALAIRYVAVDDGERPDYLARLAERTAGGRANGYHVWAFEQVDGPSRFVEFVETADQHALGTALLQDALLGESLDFRHAPADGERTGWEYFVGLPGAS